MASFNSCSFSGNVGRDPDVRYFENGNVIANFSIAVEGRRDSPTIWMPVKVWGKQASVIADHVRKGSKIIVGGELQQESWTKDGAEKSRLVLNCQNFTLLNSKKEDNGSSGSSGSSGNPGSSSSAAGRRPAFNTQPAQNPLDEDEDDIPF
jgi:single-strand DNA-binding protein